MNHNNPLVNKIENDENGQRNPLSVISILFRYMLEVTGDDVMRYSSLNNEFVIRAFFSLLVFLANSSCDVTFMGMSMR